jgi:hypothetical protein
VLCRGLLEKLIAHKSQSSFSIGKAPAAANGKPH